MDTDDDPVTVAVVGGAIFGAVQASKVGGSDAPGEVQASQTAVPEAQPSEQAKRNRRLAASSLTREFQEPTLSKPALLA